MSEVSETNPGGAGRPTLRYYRNKKSKKNEQVVIDKDTLTYLLYRGVEMRKRQNGTIRPDEKQKKKFKENKVCAVCQEQRGIDYCHILPVSVTKNIQGFEYLSNDLRNAVALCKNHHWCFDKMLLTDNELEMIYRTAKEFIEDDVLRLANSKITPKPEAKIITRAELGMMDRFSEWIKWVSKVFFIRNNEL